MVEYSSMKAILKKVVSASAIDGVLTPIARIVAWWYSLKYPPLILRPETTDLAVFQNIFILGELRLPIRIRPKLIIDAGAYTGLSTFYYATKYPKAAVIAIEPETSNYEMLVQNTKRLPNVATLNAGVWPKEAHLKVIDRATGKWGFAVREVAETDEYNIRAVTLDTVLKNSGQSVIDILKLDIEGGEKQLFSYHYQSWLSKANTIVIELHDRITPGCTQAFMSAIDPQQWNQYKEGEKMILVRKKQLQ